MFFLIFEQDIKHAGFDVATNFYMKSTPKLKIDQLFSGHSSKG